MIDSTQFRESIIAPCLKMVNLYSRNAEELLVATMANESLGGRFLVQDGSVKNGGLGAYQMEALTHDDIWDNYLFFRPRHVDTIMNACNFKEKPISYSLVWDLKYSTIMARFHYLRFKEELPDFNDLKGIWKYYKDKWNTELGKASEDRFFENYLSFVGGRHERYKKQKP